MLKALAAVVLAAIAAFCCKSWLFYVVMAPSHPDFITYRLFTRLTGVGSNFHIDLFNPEVGDKRTDVDAELNIPIKAALYILKDKDGNVLDTFERGWAKNGNAEVALPTAEGSFARTADAKKEWKVTAITMGKTNNGANVIGDISVDPE